MVKLYVEGGGDTAALKTSCRKGFTTFIRKSGIKKRPRIVACGGRSDTYKSFRRAIANRDEAILLVDSEVPVDVCYQQGKPENWQPWRHLKDVPDDGWERPKGTKDTDCHLMVQVMESWLLVDRRALRKYFGQGFKANRLPATERDIESIQKDEIDKSLGEATQSCRPKGQYNKGDHSFDLLASIDPGQIMSASPWAKRFVEELKRKMVA